MAIFAVMSLILHQSFRPETPGSFFVATSFGLRVGMGVEGAAILVVMSLIFHKSRGGSSRGGSSRHKCPSGLRISAHAKAFLTWAPLKREGGQFRVMFFGFVVSD